MCDHGFSKVRRPSVALIRANEVLCGSKDRLPVVNARKVHDSQEGVS